MAIKTGIQQRRSPWMDFLHRPTVFLQPVSKAIAHRRCLAFRSLAHRPCDQGKPDIHIRFVHKQFLFCIVCIQNLPASLNGLKIPRYPLPGKAILMTSPRFKASQSIATFWPCAPEAYRKNKIKVIHLAYADKNGPIPSLTALILPN